MLLSVRFLTHLWELDVSSHKTISDIRRKPDGTDNALEEATHQQRLSEMALNSDATV